MFSDGGQQDARGDLHPNLRYTCYGYATPTGVIPLIPIIFVSFPDDIHEYLSEG